MFYPPASLPPARILSSPSRIIAPLFLISFLLISTLRAAADTAPPPEAEPDESEAVLTCPWQGDGYFVLPGTHTCIRISGYVRSEAEAGDYLYARQRAQLHRKTYGARSRATIRLSTTTDTDLGALRSFMEVRTQWDAGALHGNPVTNDSEQMRFAYIELGGLRVGVDDSIFNRWTEYYGDVIADDLLTPLEEARTNAVSYSFSPVSLSNGSSISAILGFEQGYSDGDDSGFRYGADGVKHIRKLSQQTHDYTPNIVGGLRLDSRRASLAAVAAFDAYYSAWAGKVRLDITATDRLSLWVMTGYKSMSDYYAVDDTNLRQRRGGMGIMQTRQGIYRQINSLYGDWGGHWIVWAGSTYALSARTDLNSQISYDSSRNFAAAANVQHNLVPGLSIVPEVSYLARNDKYGYIYSNGLEEKTTLKSKESMQGMLRIQRSF